MQINNQTSMQQNSNEIWSIEESTTIQRLKFLLANGQCLRKWKKQQQKSKQRQLVLKEWLKTEQTYIEDLKIIERDIQEPLLQAKLITEEQGKLIFTNIKAMIDLSLSLYQCVDDFLATWHPHTTMIGEKLMYFHKFFMIYRQYCNNFMKALAILNRIKENPESQKIFGKLSLDLESYTIKPVQRPPKYQLLLRQYYRALPPSHQDYAIVGRTIEKYEDVNDTNNKSMDKRIKAQTMINLQTKYGGIISDRLGRQFFEQFTCTCINFKCHIYVFNDMLLLVKKDANDNPHQIYKRLNLNQTSYMVQKTNLKYFKNVIFVCGTLESVHLTFHSQTDASNFYKEVERILSQLSKRQEERMTRFNYQEDKKKILTKLKISSWHQGNSDNVLYNPKLKIVVEGTVKPKNEAMFSIRFQVVSSYNISQLVLLSLNEILKIQVHLMTQYKQTAFPKIQLKPEHFSVFESNKNKSKIIEYHSFQVEEFLNFVFRSQQLYEKWKHIAKQIGLHDAFYQFATAEQFQCNCERCLQLKKGQPLQYYQLLLRQIKNHKTPKQRFSEEQINHERQQWKKSYYSQKFIEVVINKPICSHYAIKIIDEIKDTVKSNALNFDQTMLSLKAEMGDFNFNFLQNINKPLPQIITLKIQLLTAKQITIEVTLKQDRCVRDIISKFGENNGINVYDWGLFIHDEENMIHIGNDQRIIEFARKWDVELEMMEPKKEEDYFVLIKKWSGYLASNRKVKLFLKKYLYFQPEKQIYWCQANQQRAYFLINQQFGRIKYSELQLTNSELISVCSFYMIIHHLDSIKRLMDQISIDPIKDLLPEKDWPYVEDDKFKKALVDEILKNYYELSMMSNQQNCLQVIFVKIFQILKQNKQWTTQYFPVTDYRKTVEKDYLLGINYQYFTVVRVKDRKSQLRIKLQNLKYNITTFSIFIYVEGHECRFDGKYLWKIKELIDSYQSYNRISIEQ